MIFKKKWDQYLEEGKQWIKITPAGMDAIEGPLDNSPSISLITGAVAKNKLGEMSCLCGCHSDEGCFLLLFLGYPFQ